MKDKMRQMIKLTSIYNFAKALKMRKLSKIHQKLHNENPFFYTLSPNLLVAIVKAFDCKRGEQTDKIGQGYYEFGLFKGFSFWFAEKIGREYCGETLHYYGFDSFEGLPKSTVDDHVNWMSGNYAASIEFVIDQLKKNGTDFKRVKLFKGVFSTNYFDQLKQNEKFLPVSICVIDSDIYESCVEVLNFIKDYLRVGSVLIFDDYNVFDKDDNHGERRALLEFEQSNPSFRKEHLFDFGWHGVAFKVINI